LKPDKRRDLAIKNPYPSIRLLKEGIINSSKLK
jgi:hypothetical protein